MTLHRSHIRFQLKTAGATVNRAIQASALLTLPNVGYVHLHITERGRTLQELRDAWELRARTVCGS